MPEGHRWNDSTSSAETTTVEYDYDLYAQLTDVTTTPPGGSPSTQEIDYDLNGNRQGDIVGAYNRLSFSAASRDNYYFDYEGNVTGKWNFDLIEHVGEPEPGENYFPLQTTTIDAGIYRLIFTDVVVDEQTFDVQLLDVSGIDDVLDEQSVTATGSGPYTLNTTIYLEVTADYVGQVFQIAFDNFGFNPTISSGEVHLDKFESWQAFEWDYRNRLIKAKEYTLEVNTNPDTLTLPFGNKGDMTLYLDASNEYLYDVHD